MGEVRVFLGMKLCNLKKKIKEIWSKKSFGKLEAIISHWEETLRSKERNLCSFRGRKGAKGCWCCGIEGSLKGLLYFLGLKGKMK